jgi:hypothetical protein
MPIATAPEIPTPYQDFVLQRELAEVYLLLDNLSGSPNRDLIDASPDAPKFDGYEDWIAAVCEIPWPPVDSGVDVATRIARLIRVRDYLNRRVAQANGLTIAFTLLVAGESKTQAEMAAEKPRWWARTSPALRLADTGPQSPSRIELADRAFPNLWKSARWARTWIHLAPYLVFFWLLLTCLLSWNVATGNALLGQLAGAEADLAQTESQIASAQNAYGQGDAAAKTTPAVSPPQSQIFPTSSAGATAAAVHGVTDFCRDLPAPTSGAATLYNSVTQLRLCTDLAAKTVALNAAAINLGNWSRVWTWLGVFDGGPASSCSALDGLGCARAENEQWVSSLLGVLGGSVLPIFYGLLGAGAAVVRGLSAKVRDWQLAPRDLQMSLIQLALGAVIGACIGLFVTPPGAAGGATAVTGSAAASAQGLLGPVHLSASALCFIAGFFVEGVFQALESLMRRVFFTLDDPGKSQARGGK